MSEAVDLGDDEEFEEVAVLAYPELAEKSFSGGARLTRAGYQPRP